MRGIVILFMFMSLQGFSQFQKSNSIGNFYVISDKLVWQKWYDLDNKSELSKRLKSNDFTADLDIMKFTTSCKTRTYRLYADNLPEYAQHDYEAFLSVDFIENRYRVSIKQIIFPDFIEKVYYNGLRQHSTRGTIEHYILGQDGHIKKNNANLNVLNSFDTVFSEIFDRMGVESSE